MSDQQRIVTLARRSLIVLALAWVLAIASFAGSKWLKDRVTVQMSQAKQQVSATEVSLEQRRTDLIRLQAEFKRFTVLRQQGLVGLADRPGWVEQLVASRARLGLPDALSYTLQPPKPLSLQASAEVAAAPAAAGPVGEAGSPVFHDLEFTLSGIHEEELLALLHDYQGQVHGRYRVNDCALSAPSALGLSARCTLRFFTLPDVAPSPPAQ